MDLLGATIVALQKQNINLSFTGGVDTKTDPKQVDGKLLLLENGTFISPKRIKKRSGFEHLPPLTSGRGLATFKNELVGIDSTQVNSFSQETNAWIDKGNYTSTEVTAQQIVRNTHAQSSADGTIHPNGLEVFAWEDSAGGARYSVIDSATGVSVMQDQLLNINGSKPKVLVLGQYVVIIYYNTVTHNLRAHPINSEFPQSVIAEFDISTTMNVANPSYDATTIGGRIFIAFNNSGPGISYLYINAFLLTSATQSQSSENADGCIGIFGDGTNIWIVYYNGTSIKYFVQNFALADVLAPTLIENISNIVNVTGIGITTNATIYYTKSAAATYNYLIRTSHLTSLGVVTTPTVFARSVGISSKAFQYNSINYLGVAFETVEQPTYFILNGSAQVVAKFIPSNGGGLLIKNIIPESSPLGSNSFLIATLQKDLLTTVSGTIYSQTGVTGITIDFASVIFKAELANNLFLSGGYITEYDGANVVENGFHIFPENVTQTPSGSGGSILAGTYQYSVIYQWTDNQGQLNYSAPSLAITNVTSGSTSSNALTIPTLRLSAKTSVIIGVYRTLANGTTFYQISSITMPLYNDPTVDSVMFTDTFADATIQGNPILYTTGGVLENIAAPAVSMLITGKNRILYLPSEDHLSFGYSKEITPGVPVEFSDLFIQHIDQRGGDLNSIAMMDDKIILFKENNIFFVTGDGPDNTGAQNSFSQAQLITTDAGCIDPASVVLIPSGLMFKSHKGLYLLDRSLQVSYIGAEVEAFNSQVVTASQLMVKTNQVRFCLDSGVALVFDYFYQQWSVFTNIMAVSSALFEEEFCFIQSSGVVAQETTGQYFDNMETIKLKILSAWLSFAGLQYFQRVYKFLILGEYISAHQLRVRIAYDFNPSLVQEDYIDATTLMNIINYGEANPYGSDEFYGGAFPQYQFRVFTARQKCETIQISIEDVNPDGEGLSLSALAFEVGVKQGLNKLGANRSFG